MLAETNPAPAAHLPPHPSTATATATAASLPAHFTLIGNAKQSLGGSDPVKCMALSSTMDLLAVALEQSEQVSVLRLDLQRLWTVSMDVLPSTTTSSAADQQGRQLQIGTGVKTKCVAVTSLAWRPDGKVLAVGCADASVRLLDVETGTMLHSLSMTVAGQGQPLLEDDVGITGLAWTAYGEEIPISNHPFQADAFLKHMPKLSALQGSRKSRADPESLHLRTDNTLTVLACCNERGTVQLLALGILPLGRIELLGKPELQYEPLVKPHLHLTSDLSTFLAIGKASPSSCFLRTFQTGAIQRFHREIHALASKYSDVQTLMRILHEGLDAMKQEYMAVGTLAKQHIRKLECILDDQGAESTTPTIEFMTFLATGVASPSLVYFLNRELGFKGLSKWIKGAEAGYQELSRLIAVHLLPACQRMLLHLTDVIGFGRWREKYGELGLEERGAQEFINAVSSLVIRLEELHTTVESEMQNFAVFYKWLATMMALHIEEVPEDMKFPTDSQDTIKIVNYIRNSLNRDCLHSFFSSSAVSDSLKPLFGGISRSTSKQSLSSKSGMLHSDGFHLGIHPGKEKRGSFGSNVTPSASLSSLVSGQSVHYKASFTEIMRSLEERMEALFCAPSHRLEHSIQAQHSSEQEMQKDALPLLSIQSDPATKEAIVALVNDAASEVYVWKLSPGCVLCVRLSIKELLGPSGETMEHPAQIRSMQPYGSFSLMMLLDIGGYEHLVKLNLEQYEQHWSSSTTCDSVPLSLEKVRTLGRSKGTTSSSSASRLTVDASRKLALVLSRDARKATIFDLAADEADDDDGEEEEDTGEA